jgi:pimeloyl-ACP methyl ester carboxylesterase
MRFIRPSAFIVAALLGSGCTTMQIKENSFIRPDKPGAATPARLDLRMALPDARVTDAAIDSGDGATLRGVMVRQAQAKVTVLYFGGNAFHLDQHGAEIIPLIAACGVNVAVFDYRGYGRSGGMPTVATMAADALREYDYVSAHNQGHKVIVHGQSLGSFMAAHVAQARPQAAALVLEATATNVSDWAHANVPWYARPFLRLDIGQSLRGVDNVTAVAGYPGASLVLAGQADTVTPPALGRRVFEALPPARRQWLLADGASHNGIFGHKDVMPAYCAFVNQ